MKISRAERKKRATERREEIRAELLDVMHEELKRGDLEQNKVLDVICRAADRKVKLLISIKPQEKTLILAAARSLGEELEKLIFKKKEFRK